MSRPKSRIILFLSETPFHREEVSPSPVLPSPLFFVFTFLDDIYFLCQSHFPDAPQIFHMLMEIHILLSALTLSFNSLTQAGERPARAGEEAGGKLKDILHNYRGFLFR